MAKSNPKDRARTPAAGRRGGDTGRRRGAANAHYRNAGKNYMPYAMSVIVSRALPEIDGFKPAHRKLLYTMYGMGLLKGGRTKSANIVGSTMHLNPPRRRGDL